MKPEEARASRAVLFGIHEFRYFGALTGVQHNLTALLAVLTAPDICALPHESCVTVPSDASPGEMLDALEDAAEGAEHLLLVYYAGHGHHGADGNLLLATAHSRARRSYHSVHYETVRTIVAESPARHKVVIIDCCWSGLAHMDDQEDAVDFDVPGTCVITSAAATEKSLCEPEGSVFTLALTELLTEGLSGPLPDGSRAERLPQLAMDHVYDALCARLDGRQVAGRSVPRPRMSARDAGHRIPIAHNRAYVGGATSLDSWRSEYQRVLATRASALPSVAGRRQPSVPAGTGAECPFCLRHVVFDENRLVEADVSERRFVPLSLDPTMSPVLRHTALRKAFYQCPHEGTAKHELLPASYYLHDEPLTIAMIGAPASGKTTLLASMMLLIEAGALEPFGLQCLPLSTGKHNRYFDQHVQSLCQGRVLPATARSSLPHYTDGLLVTAGGRTIRPVLFFDFAGEDLSPLRPEMEFLLGAGGFIFVLDSLSAFPMASLESARRRFGTEITRSGGSNFHSVIDCLPRRGYWVDAPAAVAVAKSDLLSFDPVVDRWLTKEIGTDIRELSEESEDAYAFTRHHGGRRWVEPFHHFSHCSLHFVSATGGPPQPSGDTYTSDVTPLRVLGPLLAIFSAAGLLNAPAA
ncbi:caspase, EACC1-associated type [Streptomyces hawaiiensis]|uniref:caspase, EACC1-associated type n=1 Tax=Streptomyces hawaiiensis TaxID=67305 RepID=UPI0036467E07